MPRLQRHVIRILWMVPIYAVDCWRGTLWDAHFGPLVHFGRHLSGPSVHYSFGLFQRGVHVDDGLHGPSMGGTV